MPESEKVAAVARDLTARVRPGISAGMRISIVLTTHNRPALLAEAVGSVLAQTSDAWELVVVDDGSTLAAEVPVHALGAMAARVRFIRHEIARGPSEARNSGVAAAQGDVVTFLDDDDLLAPSAIAELVAAFDDDIDCLFVRVGCFGPFAPGTLENQDIAMRTVLHYANGIVDSSRPVIRFQRDKLFAALLQRLPMAFQRAAVRPEAFARIGPYRGKDFSDLEWNYRAVLRCRTALLDRNIYLVRCEGQSYFSREKAAHQLGQTIIRIRGELLRLPEIEQSPALRNHVQRALCRAHFDACWHSIQRSAAFPWSSFALSCRSGIGWRHLSLLGRVLQQTLFGRP